MKKLIVLVIVLWAGVAFGAVPGPAPTIAPAIQECSATRFVFTHFVESIGEGHKVRSSGKIIAEIFHGNKSVKGEVTHQEGCWWTLITKDSKNSSKQVAVNIRNADRIEYTDHSK